MVDFNNETTIGIPATEIVKVLVLQRQADTIEALEDYKKKQEAGINVGLSILKARLFSWFVMIEPGLRRKYTPEELRLIEQNLNSDNERVIFSLVRRFTEYLDFIRLTRLDVRDLIDTTRTEYENRSKRL